MREYYRWTAFLGAAVLTLSSPVQVFADETVQTGSSIETAVVVPSLSVGEDIQTVVAPADGTVSGTVNGTVNGTANGLGGTGSVVVETQAPTDAGLSGIGSVTVNPGTLPADTGTTPAGTGNVQAGTTGTTPAGTGNIQAGTTGTTPADTGTASKPKDYSRGPGFAVEEEPVQEPAVVENVSQELLPIPNPVQVLPSQPIRGFMAQDGSVMLADVVDSIVQVADKYCYDQMILDMSLLKVRYGDKIHIQEMGESLDNRKIYDCIIGNVQAPKHLLIQGGIHAREYINPLILMQQMELILANYDTGSFHNMPLSEMFNYVAIHFVPMTNPDGISISQFGPEAIRSAQLREEINQCYFSDLARGKASLDTASYYSHWKANARGVDLNLNFDALWEEIGAGIPSSNGFRGVTPASEPETQAMVNLYNNPAYPWAAALHYHSMGNVIYWDIRGNKVQAQSRDLAQLMSNVTGGYRILPSTGGGGYKDWIQLSEHPVPSVTLETGTVSCPIPSTYYGEIWSQNCLTWAYAMEWAATH